MAQADITAIPIDVCLSGAGSSRHNVEVPRFPFLTDAVEKLGDVDGAPLVVNARRDDIAG
jgi:hypothetical protein